MVVNLDFDGVATAFGFDGYCVDAVRVGLLPNLDELSVDFNEGVTGCCPFECN